MQAEVDFVLPKAGVDVPLGIDPFLLYKSHEQESRHLHAQLVKSFNLGIDYFRSGNIDFAEALFSFPEPAEIGLGYSEKRGKRGSGVGGSLRASIFETLEDSPELREVGVGHVEEMQLLSMGVGPDRVSDIAANLLKSELIAYTQRQAAIWGLEQVSGVPVHHIFNHAEMEWEDGYYDLPISPIDGSAVLLVPRRWVRTLPWINYPDFTNSDFGLFLRSTLPGGKKRVAPKDVAVRMTRRKVEHVKRYVRSKEANAKLALPAIDQADSTCGEADRLTADLMAIPTGASEAANYQRLVLAILNYVFNPDLSDGQLEVRTVHGTERRDIIFTNESEHSFWDYTRSEHSSLLVMFEVKNTKEISPDHVNQTSTYLGDRLGRLGFIVTRSTPTESNMLKTYSVFNDSNPKKVVLFLSDEMLIALMRDRCEGRNPSKRIQDHYRKFKVTVQ